MSQLPVLFNAFDAKLRPEGFKRKADTWYRRGDELMQLVNLQKSPWGAQYHVNVAWWLTALGAEQFPKEHRSHLRGRCNIFVSQDRRVLDHMLDFEDLTVSAEERAAAAASLFVDLVLPFLQQTQSLAGLREKFVTGMWPVDFSATRAALDAIGVVPRG